MSEEHSPENDVNEEWEDEEICPQEVESVVHRLDQILATVESDTIHQFLMDAYERIEELVEWQDDEQIPPADAA